MHDWSRAPGWLWHQMELGWALALCDACNRLLPQTEYYALTEYASASPDSSISFDVPDTAFDGLDDEAFAAAKRRSVAVRRVKDHRKVALIEVTCPAIKRSEAVYSAFIAKALAARELGLGMLVIDPFPPGKFDPDGIPSAIWQSLSGRALARSADQPLTVASFLPSRESVLLVELVAVGDTLPEMPLGYEPECVISMPLESTYTAAWQTFPAEWRNVITGEGA
jgi:hypothetical protein